MNKNLDKFKKVTTGKEVGQESEFQRFCENPIIKALYSNKSAAELRKRFNRCKNEHKMNF